MKKAINPLLLTALLLAVFTVGVMVGRSTNYNNVAITVEKGQPKADVGSNISPSDSAPSMVFQLNINTATAEELQDVPGIGPALAQRIVTYREEHGIFDTVNELLNVSGIGEKKLSAMMDHITVGG